MTYYVVLHREAKKDIKKLHPQIRNRVITALDEIAENPRRHGAIMLTGYVDLYRYRVGHHRIVSYIELTIMSWRFWFSMQNREGKYTKSTELTNFCI